MDTIKIFRKANKISQVALAEYLHVTQGFISQIENGTTAIPDTVISKLLANPYNWNVSMLTDQSRYSKPELVAERKPQLSNVEILLRDMLAEKEAKIDVLQERINELIEENARLKTLIEGERKGGVA
jgi:transcriptional regulator with XRE-family HTH domain